MTRHLIPAGLLLACACAQAAPPLTGMLELRWGDSVPGAEPASLFEVRLAGADGDRHALDPASALVGAGNLYALVGSEVAVSAQPGPWPDGRLVVERFGDVQGALGDRVGAAPAWPEDADGEAQVRARVDELLAAPLTPETAVEIALLNSRRLRASYARLGVSQASLVEALSREELSFGHVCDRIMAEVGEDEAPAEAFRLLAQWVQDGLIRRTT